jgi:hypothetical protein
MRLDPKKVGVEGMKVALILSAKPRLTSKLRESGEGALSIDLSKGVERPGWLVDAVHPDAIVGIDACLAEHPLKVFPVAVGEGSLGLVKCRVVSEDNDGHGRLRYGCIRL